MSKKFELLKAHILSISESDEFGIARKEWILYDIEYHEEFGQCNCSQAIKEFCFIRNELNGNETHVGNVCINKFIGIDTGNLFEGLKRIIKDDCANANEDLIIHSRKFGYIFENEYKFLMQTKAKRKLSNKQLNWKRKINNRIINKTVVSG